MISRARTRSSPSGRPGASMAIDRRSRSRACGSSQSSTSRSHNLDPPRLPPGGPTFRELLGPQGWMPAPTMIWRRFQALEAPAVHPTLVYRPDAVLP
jgi:hypothetical protein